MRIIGLDGTKRPAPETWALIDLVTEKPPKGFSIGLIDILGMDPRPTDPDEGAVNVILAALEGVGAKAVTIVAVAPDRLQITCHIPREVPRAAAHRDPTRPPDAVRRLRGGPPGAWPTWQDATA